LETLAGLMVRADRLKRQNGSRFGGAVVKKAITLVLEDTELIELTRILMDEDADAALAFLKQHLKGKLREALEGG
jgi:hypothetical protein